MIFILVLYKKEDFQQIYFKLKNITKKISLDVLLMRKVERRSTKFIDLICFMIKYTLIVNI